MAKKKKIKKMKKLIKKVIKKVKKLTKTANVKKIKKGLKTKKVVKPKNEKVLGKVEHFFDKISVAAVGVKAPFKVGDILHIKGHTTDFNQRLESMQIEHQSVQKVKKGDDVGIRVLDFVRGHDIVYLAANQKEVETQPVKAESKSTPASQPKPSAPANQKPMFQTSIFQTEKPISPPAVKPVQIPSSLPSQPALGGLGSKPVPKPQPKKESKEDPYSKTKFFNF